jgi:hypothetical protein
MKTYGRRKDDMDIEGLTPEAVASLTDTQKINIKIIQNLTSLNTSVNDLRHDVGVHDKLLVTGNGTPSIQERLRNLETYTDTLKYWGKFVGGAIVVQTVAFFVAIIVALVRFLPLLEQLAAQP